MSILHTGTHKVRDEADRAHKSLCRCCWRGVRRGRTGRDVRWLLGDSGDGLLGRHEEGLVDVGRVLGTADWRGGRGRRGGAGHVSAVVHPREREESGKSAYLVSKNGTSPCSLHQAVPDLALT
jgi:hypothetical protein